MEGLEDLLSSCLSNLKSGRGCEYNEVRYHDFHLIAVAKNLLAVTPVSLGWRRILTKIVEHLYGYHNEIPSTNSSVSAINI